MAYITREDGERFIIPSYRDVLSAKKPALLRREVLLLSSNYGEYIALQRKNAEQYEVAFSSEPGYLLGESVWSYFKRPADLIYCEAIPDTFEAILVIVKSGIVYLDGSFPLDSIAEELVIFRTQQNFFDIYIYGEVPISKLPEEGKFAFDQSSVKSFNVLENPVFPAIPLARAFQLQLVDTVLKSRGIGVLPIKKIIAALVILGLFWLAWNYFSSYKKQLPQVFINAVNPMQGYTTALTSASPIEEIHWVSDTVLQLGAIPGWAPDSINYANGSEVISVHSLGARTHLLYAWGEQNAADISMSTKGIIVTKKTYFNNRNEPATISPIDKVIAVLIDSMSYILPGNVIDVAETINKGKYFERAVTITFDNITVGTLDLIADQLKGLPLILTKLSIKIDNGRLSGSINLRALGN